VKFDEEPKICVINYIKLHDTYITVNINIITTGATDRKVLSLPQRHLSTVDGAVHLSDGIVVSTARYLVTNRRIRGFPDRVSVTSLFT